MYTVYYDCLLENAFLNLFLLFLLVFPQASDAGITLTQEDSSDAAGILKEQELEIDTILADEALARAKAQASQNRELAIEQQHKMSENLTAAIVSPSFSWIYFF